MNFLKKTVFFALAVTLALPAFPFSSASAAGLAIVSEIVAAQVVELASAVGWGMGRPS